MTRYSLTHGIVQSGQEVIAFPSSGLTGYWNFNEVSGVTSTDSINGFRATASNSGLLNATGKNLKSLDGIGNTFNSVVSSSNVQDLYPNGDMSVSLWVNTVDTNTDQSWLDAGGSTGQRSFRIATFPSTDNIRILIGDGAEWIVGNISIASVDYNQWMHLVLSFDSVNGWKFYKNGIEVASGSTGFNIGFSSNGLIIMNNWASVSTPDDNYGNSKLDELAFYDRAINQSEVSLIYKGGAGRYYSSAVVPPPFLPVDINNLIGWWGDTVNNGVDRTTLVEGTLITNWDDLSGNGNDWFESDFNVNPPTYDSTKNSISFNGSNKALRNNFQISYAGFTYFWVSNISSNSQSYQISNTWFRFESGRNTFSLRSRYDVNGGVQQGLEVFGLGNGDGIDFRESYGTAADLGSTPHIFRGELKENDYASISLDSSFVLSGSTTYNSSDQYLWKMMGGETVRDSFANFDAYELVVYNRILSQSEINQVETYLNDKYNIY